MKRLVLFFAVLAVVFAFTSTPLAVTDELLQNRYVNSEMGVISYDVLLPRQFLDDPERYERVIQQMETQLAQKFLQLDRGVPFTFYIIDIMFVPVRYNDPPRVLEVSREYIERLIASRGRRP